MKDQSTEKYLVDSTAWYECCGEVGLALARYQQAMVNRSEDYTKKMGRIEFWKRLAEFHGFEIKFNHETAAPLQGDEK